MYAVHRDVLGQSRIALVDVKEVFVLDTRSFNSTVAAFYVALSLIVTIRPTAEEEHY
jgi:hypothetical protein